jgi:hypothetical protein
MMLDPQFSTFLWGAFGSAAVEVVGAFTALSQDEVVLPPKYRRPSYYVSRIVMAAVAGGVAVAQDITAKPWLALQIGAGAPLILTSIAQGFKNLPTLGSPESPRSLGSGDPPR